MNIKNKITNLLKQQDKTLRDLSIHLDTSEVALHYMFKNNTFKFDVMDKISMYLNVDISYFSDRNEVSNIDEFTKNRTISYESLNKVELSNPLKTSMKVENVKNSIEIDEINSFVHDISISLHISQLLVDFLHNNFFNEYEELYRCIYSDVDRGGSIKEVVERYNPKLKDIIGRSNINNSEIAEVKKYLISIFNKIKSSASDDIYNEIINEIVLSLGRKSKK